MTAAATPDSSPAPVPAHVPPGLVFDFDVYNAAGPDQDFHLAIKRLHEPDVPEVFWTPRHGGHWVLTRAEEIHKVFADYEHFSNHALTVPKSTAPTVPLYPIFLDPPAAHDVSRPAQPVVLAEGGRRPRAEGP